MGRDRGKFNKRGGRGGRGSRFQATSADEIELRNSRVAQFDAARAKRRAEADDEDVENEGASDAEEELTSKVKGLKIAKEEEKSSEPRPMTRKEREEKEKEQKAADYRRRHELGLTEEYKRDMTKLAEVKKRREDAQQRAAAEKEVETELEKEIKAEAAAASKSEEDSKKKKSSKKKKGTEIPKLDKISIKKMKPSQLKEALKLRGLEIQGNSKALTERLLAYETAR